VFISLGVHVPETMIRQRSARFPAKLPASADDAAAAKGQGARRGSQQPKPQCRGSKVNFSVGRRKSVFPVVNKREVARSRWKHAIRKVLAFIRFQIPITSRGRDEEGARMLEPTYRLEPDGDEKFRGSLARAAMERALRDRLDDYEYNRVSAPKLAKRLAALINDEMKGLGFTRYKFISTVLIVENKQQDMCVASRCVWDPKFDDYVTLEVKGATFVAVACVHGVYVD
jgi:hypothetical protein